MINETICEQLTNATTVFEQHRIIYSEPSFLVPILIAIVLSWIFYLLAGILVEAKTPSGRSLGKPMIANKNVWWTIFALFIFTLILIFGAIFPVWGLFV